MIAEFEEKARALNMKRAASLKKQGEALLSRHAEGEFVYSRMVEKKMVALRRVFVLLDVDGDGLISHADMMSRMQV